MPLAYYLKQPSVIATASAFFGYSYLLFFFLTWFPTYLSKAHGLSIQNMGLVTSIPWTLGFLGLLASGFVVDFILKRTGRALFSAKAVLVAGLFIAAICVGLAGIVTSVDAAVALMAVTVFCMYLTGTTYWAIILDVVEKPRVGGVSGFVHFVANCAGIVAPTITGFLVEYGSFQAAFAFAGLFALLGAIAVVVLVKPIPVLSGVPAVAE